MLREWGRVCVEGSHVHDNMMMVKGSVGEGKGGRGKGSEGREEKEGGGGRRVGE